MSLRLSFHVISMSIERLLSHRINFILGRCQNLFFLLLLYSLWTHAFQNTSHYADFTKENFIMYLLAGHVVRAFVFGTHSALTAGEINYGIFSTYLTKPLNHLWFCFCREWGEKILLTASALGEVGLIVWYTKTNVSYLSSAPLATFVILVSLGHLLYFLLSYCLNLLAFWSREVGGPRFLFVWLIECTSGTMFPLTLLSNGWKIIFNCLPFQFFFYIPLATLLKNSSSIFETNYFITSFIWLILSICLAYSLWTKGLRHYSGEGI